MFVIDFVSKRILKTSQPDSFLYCGAARAVLQGGLKFIALFTFELLLLHMNNLNVNGIVRGSLDSHDKICDAARFWRQ